MSRVTAGSVWRGMPAVTGKPGASDVRILVTEVRDGDCYVIERLAGPLDLALWRMPTISDAELSAFVEEDYWVDLDDPTRTLQTWVDS